MVYRIGGFDLYLEDEDLQSRRRIDSLWQTLFYGTFIKSAMPRQSVRLRIIAYPVPPQEITYSVLQLDGLKLWRTPDGYCLSCSASTAVLDAVCGEGIVYLSPDFWQRPLLQQRQFFQTAIVILLHGIGGYHLHANSVVLGQDGLLIVGHSGSGKSTLTLGLVHAHWRCLGDDALILRNTDNAVQAHALRRGFACTAHTATQFPALADALATAPALSDRKKLLDLETLWPDCFTPVCTPRLIVFPEIVDASRTRLTPLNPTQSLCALMEQGSGIFLIDALVARQQMVMLSQLTRQARGYRLLAGRDVYAEPERVATLLRCAISTG